MEGLLYLEGGGKAVSSLAWPWRCGHNAGSNGAHFNCPAHPSPLPSLVQLGRGHPDPFLSPLSLLSHFHFLSLHTPHFCHSFETLRFATTLQWPSAMPSGAMAPRHWSGYCLCSGGRVQQSALSESSEGNLGRPCLPHPFALASTPTGFNLSRLPPASELSLPALTRFSPPPSPYLHTTPPIPPGTFSLGPISSLLTSHKHPREVAAPSPLPVRRRRLAPRSVARPKRPPIASCTRTRRCSRAPPCPRAWAATSTSRATAAWTSDSAGKGASRGEGLWQMMG